MDRERLKQVQQTDLTESKLNQDFVDWLKNRGPTYLLVILVVLVGFVGLQKYRQSKAQGLSDAFADLDGALNPDSCELVAEDHPGVGSVPELALVKAGDFHYTELLLRRDSEDFELLTDDQLRTRRDQAIATYERVASDTEGNDKQILIRVYALFGLAALLESGDEPDLDGARSRYEEIAQVAAEKYPELAARVESRIATLDELRGFTSLPKQSDLPPRDFFDPLLKDLFEEHGLEPS